MPVCSGLPNLTFCLPLMFAENVALPSSCGSLKSSASNTETLIVSCGFALKRQHWSHTGSTRFCTVFVVQLWVILFGALSRESVAKASGVSKPKVCGSCSARTTHTSMDSPRRERTCQPGSGRPRPMAHESRALDLQSLESSRACCIRRWCSTRLWTNSITSSPR